MGETASYHVLTCHGDALREVEDALRSIGTPEEAGLFRHFFVTRANQTVVMATGEDAPIAKALRGRAGWREPRE